jgi:benzoyl-coA reductase
MKIQEILDILHNVAVSPEKQLEKYLAENKKVVAVAPVYTPEEIIHSMGIVPMGVWGADMEVREAKTYYPAFICSIMQTVLELGIKGKYKGVSAIVIPSLCDSLKTLGQNWKYAVKDIPFIPMSYPQNRKPDYGIKFTKSSYERVIKELEKITGNKFSEEKLAESNKIYNEHNAVMREFSEIAAVKKISASQRNDVFKSAWFMLKEEHTALVRQLIDALKSEPEDNNEYRVYVTGILADSPSLLEIFDKNNLKIVADDVAHESRQYRTDIPDSKSPLDDLAEKFAAMDNCTLLYDRDKKRVDYIIDEAKKHKAKGILVLMTKFCDPEEFDYVPIKRACDKAGLAHINIEVDRQMVNYQQAGTMVQAFKEML